MRTSDGPTVDRLEFAQLCRGIDEFELLPDHTRGGLVDERSGLVNASWESDAQVAWELDAEQPTALNEVILAGLVSPV